jgi:hypothetical protein
MHRFIEGHLCRPGGLQDEQRAWVLAWLQV